MYFLMTRSIFSVYGASNAARDVNLNGTQCAITIRTELEITKLVELIT